MSEFYLCAVFGYNFFPGKQMGYVPASWTLSVEMIFYLFFPLLFKWVTNFKKSVTFLLLTLLISYIHHVVMSRLNSDKYIIDVSIASHLPTFATGIVIFYIYRAAGKKKPRYKSLSIFIIGLVLFFTMPYLFVYTNAGYFIRTYTMTLIYAIIFIGMAIRPVSFFTNRVSVFFGTISYSLYLNHPQVIWLLEPVYKNIYSQGLPVSLSWFICTMLTFVPLTGVSYITYRFIEKPGMAIGKKIIKKITLCRENKRKISAPAQQFDSSII